MGYKVHDSTGSTTKDFRIPLQGYYRIEKKREREEEEKKTEERTSCLFSCFRC